MDTDDRDGGESTNKKSCSEIKHLHTFTGQKKNYVRIHGECNYWNFILKLKTKYTMRRKIHVTKTPTTISNKAVHRYQYYVQWRWQRQRQQRQRQGLWRRELQHGPLYILKTSLAFPHSSYLIQSLILTRTSVMTPQYGSRKPAETIPPIPFICGIYQSIHGNELFGVLDLHA